MREASMPITVGQDTSKTRKTLRIDRTEIAYYSIPAAEAAGLGDFSKIPAALTVVAKSDTGKYITIRGW